MNNITLCATESANTHIVFIDNRHVGSVSQARGGTEFCTPKGEVTNLGKRITLSGPEKAGWQELYSTLVEKGLVSE